MEYTERQKNMMMDRAFDAACLAVKEENEWADQIMTRLKSTYPELPEYLNNMYEFYVNMVTNNKSFLARADYMIENRDKIRLHYK